MHFFYEMLICLYLHQFNLKQQDLHISLLTDFRFNAMAWFTL